MDSRWTGADAARLRIVEHPDLSATLVHFVDRGREPGPGVPADIREMDAEQRLTAILQQGSITPFMTFSQGFPALCMTEMSWAGLDFMISSRGYRPWALMFDRQAVYDAGGGPVWYARPAEYAALAETPALRSWAVRWSPDSEWVEEREWRVPRRPDSQGRAAPISLAELGLCGVIIDEPDWSCPALSPFGDGSCPEHWVDAVGELPRYWWEGQQLVRVG
ncbi:hypothetical protein [Nocardia sp. NPDC047038]|uniref:hypothetical protein n=1 Tax=Nocardia sp. NPDC047038 TaxID=3154338 RepID=UPI0033DD552F